MIKLVIIFTLLLSVSSVHGGACGNWMWVGVVGNITSWAKDCSGSGGTHRTQNNTSCSSNSDCPGASQRYCLSGKNGGNYCGEQLYYACNPGCDINCCPYSCGAWGACSKTCGPGVEKRWCDGNCPPCEPDQWEERACNLGPCCVANQGDPCGNCGTIACDGTCTGQGVCSPTSKQCSGNNLQTCTASCNWNSISCVPGMCDAPNKRCCVANYNTACGACGEGVRDCNGVCVTAANCSPTDALKCTGSEVQECNTTSCQWTTIEKCVDTIGTTCKDSLVLPLPAAKCCFNRETNRCGDGDDNDCDYDIDSVDTDCYKFWDIGLRVRTSPTEFRSIAVVKTGKPIDLTAGKPKFRVKKGGTSYDVLVGLDNDFRVLNGGTSIWIKPPLMPSNYGLVMCDTPVTSGMAGDSHGDGLGDVGGDDVVNCDSH